MSKIQQKIKEIFKSVGLNWEDHNIHQLFSLNKKSYIIESVIEKRRGDDEINIIKISSSTGYKILDIHVDTNPSVTFYIATEEIPFLTQVLSSL